MENKEKVFLLWGQDAEMQQIKKKLEKYWIPHIDKNLWWGASVKDYENEILDSPKWKTGSRYWIKWCWRMKI